MSGTDWDMLSPIRPTRRESMAPSERVFGDLLKVEDAGNFAERARQCSRNENENGKKSYFTITPKSLLNQPIEDFNEGISNNESKKDGIFRKFNV